MSVISILIVGVGGQGSLLASRILGALAESAGYDVKVSEVHGMAQRGGSVVTYVRMGDKVHSPLIEKGGADFMLAFEMLEGLRYRDMLKEGGVAVINNQRISPLPVIMGNVEYPAQQIREFLESGNTHVVDALQIAEKAGNIRTANTVLLGKLAKLSSIGREK